MKKLVIDTETTGLSPRFNKTLTVGMLLIEVNHEFLNLLDSNHLFIKHDFYNTDPAALKVNKINIEEHHKIASPPRLVCQNINNFIQKNDLRETPIVGHNITFDQGFLNALFDQGKSNSILSTESIDTMHIWNSLKRKGYVPWSLRSNLQTVADYFRIDYTKAHDALADCHITAKVYHEMLKLLKS